MEQAAGAVELEGGGADVERDPRPADVPVGDLDVAVEGRRRPVPSMMRTSGITSSAGTGGTIRPTHA